jgi:hypothetical protein
VKPRAEEAVGFLEDWEELKEAYDDAAKTARKEVWDVAKQVIKEKGDSKAVKEFFEGLKDLIDQEMLTGRKATGMTPVLKRYDKLLDAMDEMKEKKVPPRDESWKPYVKDVNSCTADFAKAYAAVKTNFGKVIERQEDEIQAANRNANLRPQLAGVRRQLVGKSHAAEAVLTGADKIKSGIHDRMGKIQGYLTVR